MGRADPLLCILFSLLFLEEVSRCSLDLCGLCTHTQTFPLVSFSGFRLAEGVGEPVLFYRLSHILQILVCDKSDILICICLALNGFRICARKRRVLYAGHIEMPTLDLDFVDLSSGLIF